MKKIKYIILAGALFAAASCSGFLEEAPQTSIAKEGVYNSVGSANAALAGCYAQFSGYDYLGYNYVHVLNVTSGMGTSYKINDANMASMNAMTTDPNITKVYSAIYRTINVANDIIQGMQTSTIKGPEHDRILGEAHFLRAVSYFNAVRLFGKLSIYTEPATSYAEVQKPRSEEREVYEQVILPDLEKAVALLPEPKAKVIGHPHKMAAKTYLARVYQTLAADDSASPYWQKCYDAAKEVYDSKAYKLVRPFAALFGEENKNNDESIFEIQFSATVNGGRLTEMTFPVGHPMMPNIPTKGKSWGKTRPNHSAFNQFDEQDPRREVSFVYGSYRNIYMKKDIALYPTKKSQSGNIGATFNATESEYPAWKKYHSSGMTASATNTNFVFARYADVLLMLAEAANEMGNSAEAADYLNQVLDRARDLNGDNVIDPSTEVYPLPVSAEELGSQELMRERIIRERLKEFTGECDEWYTLRRRGTDMLKKVMEVHNAEVTDWYGGKFPKFVYTFDVSDDNVKKNMLLPFPSDEINRNEHINIEDQNFGY